MSRRAPTDWDFDRVNRWDRRIKDKHEPEGRYRVDDQSWHDLGMDEVFTAIAGARSVVGAQVLYWLLRHPALDAGARADTEELLAAVRHPGTETRLARAFTKLPPRIGWLLPELLFGSSPSLPVPRWLLSALPLGLVLSLVVGFTLDGSALLLALVCFIGSIYSHYTLDRLIGTQTSSLIYLRGLLVLARDLVRDPPSGLEAPAARLETLLAPVKPILRATWMLGIQDPFEFSTYLRVVTLVEARGYADTIVLIRREQASLRELVFAIGELDALRAVAQLREDPSYTVPRLDPRSKTLELEGLRHPCLPEAEPNALGLGARGLLLTGLNMSGKSTLLRALGVGAIMAQALQTTRAHAYRGPFVRVMSAIEVHDDLLAGRSYYLAEVESVARLITAAESSAPHLFLLDETFRGTNSIERVAASTSLFLHLAAEHRVVAATHDMEVCELAAARFDNFHFGDVVDEQGVRFDYQLRPGPCPTTNAIRLLEQTGFPAALVAHARALIAARDGSGPNPAFPAPAQEAEPERSPTKSA